MNFKIRFTILLALLSSVAYGAAGDITWPNKNVDGDHVFCVTDAAPPCASVVTIDGATSSTIFDSISATTGIQLKNRTGATVLDFTQTEDTGTTINSHESTTARNLTFTQGALGTVGNLVNGTWTLGPSTADVTHGTRGGMSFTDTDGAGATISSTQQNISNASSAAFSTNTADYIGILIITKSTETYSCIYAINGSAATTTEMSDSGNACSPTGGTGSSLNIYSTGGVYRVENNRSNSVITLYFINAGTGRVNFL